MLRFVRYQGDKTPIILMSGALPPADLKALGGFERVTCYEKVTLMADAAKAIDELACKFQIERPTEPELEAPTEPSEESDNIPGDPEEPRAGK